MNKSGIYAIHCNVNNKYYIGKSVDMNHRKNQHFQALNRNCHNNKNLQFDYNKYGKDNFSFIELVTCPEDMLNHMEHYWIKKYDSINNGYNIINATTNLNLKNSTTDDINFIELENEYYKFFTRNFNNMIEDDSQNVSIYKIKVLMDLLNNDNIDFDFIIKFLSKNNIKLYCIVTPKNPLFDIDCGLDEYEMEIDGDTAIDYYNDIDIFIKQKFTFSKHQIDKIKNHNDNIYKQINDLENQSKEIKNNIIKISISFLEFYEHKTLKEINQTIDEKNKLYDQLNKLNNELNLIEKTII